MTVFSGTEMGISNDWSPYVGFEFFDLSWETLTNEYTDALLLAYTTNDLGVMTDLDGLEWGQRWAREDHHQTPAEETLPTNEIYSAYLLATNHASIQLQKLHYRWSLPSVSGVVYKVIWWEKFIPANGGSTTTVVQRTTNVLGTGGTVYTPAFDLRPPATEGHVYPVPMESALQVEFVEILGAPSDGLVVENGDDVTFAAHILPADFVPPADEPKWYYQKLKSDGTWEAWTSFGANAYGTQYVHATTASGIFRVKTVLSIGGVTCEKLYERTSDELNGYGKAGDPDAFGVSDTQIQIDIRNAAKAFLGSTDYEVSDVVAAQYGFPEVVAGANKCNIFVAHRAAQAGATVPLIGGYFGVDPPSANQWAGQDDTHPILPPGVQTDIDHWILFLNPTYPQPGFIVGHPNLTDSGHVGIVDYDGQGIGAGVSGTVNKKYPPFLDGTSGFRKYEP